MDSKCYRFLSVHRKGDNAPHARAGMAGCLAAKANPRDTPRYRLRFPDTGVALGQQARRFIERTFLWEAHWNRLGQLLQFGRQRVHWSQQVEGSAQVSANLLGRGNASC